MSPAWSTIACGDLPVGEQAADVDQHLVMREVVDDLLDVLEGDAELEAHRLIDLRETGFGVAAARGRVGVGGVLLQVRGVGIDNRAGAHRQARVVGDRVVAAALLAVGAVRHEAGATFSGAMPITRCCFAAICAQ